MDLVTTRGFSVYPVLHVFFDGITPPLIAEPTITAARTPSLPLEGPWLEVRILVVLVCLPCNTKVQFQTFRILVVMVYQPTPSSHKSQNYAPHIERLVRHSVNCNRTIHIQSLLILMIVADLTEKSIKVGFFRGVTKTGSGKMKNGSKTLL